MLQITCAYALQGIIGDNQMHLEANELLRALVLHRCNVKWTKLPMLWHLGPFEVTECFSG